MKSQLNVISTVVFICLAGNIGASQNEFALDRNKPQDKVAASLIKKKIPKKYGSFSIVGMDYAITYTLSDDINSPDQEGESRPISYEMDMSYMKYIQKETGQSSGRGSTDFSFEYEPGKSDVEIIEARRIKGDGRFLRVRKEDIKNESITENPQKAVYRNLYHKAFSLKDVQKGDFVEIKTNKIFKNKMGPYGFGTRYWFGNDDYPILNEKICIVANKNTPVSFKLLDIKNIVKKSSKNVDEAHVKYCFAAQNIEPKIKEPYTPSRVYSTPVLYVTTWKDWKDYGQWLAKKYEGKFKADKNIEKTVQSITKNCRNKEEKIAKIFHWIQKNVYYVQVYLDFDSDWIPTQAGEVFRRKFGDCKDKATLFISMLAVAGVKAFPVDIPTSGIVDADTDFPMMYQFNHMITYVEEIGKFLDPVGSDTPYPYLLEMDDNRSVLILKNEEVIKSKTPWKNYYDFDRDVLKRFEIVIPSKQSSIPELKGTATYTFRGNYASDWHEKAGYSKEEMDYHVKNKFFSSAHQVKSYRIVNPLDDFSLPVIIHSGYTQRLKDVSYISSKPTYIMLPSFLDLPASDDFYTQKHRVYPYSWYSSIFWRRHRFEIKIPKGYYVKAMPENILFNDKDAAFEYRASCKVVGDKIEIDEIFKVKKPILEPDEFASVQKILPELLLKMENRILLVAEGK